MAQKPAAPDIHGVLSAGSRWYTVSGILCDICGFPVIRVYHFPDGRVFVTHQLPDGQRDEPCRTQ